MCFGKTLQSCCAGNFVQPNEHIAELSTIRLQHHGKGPNMFNDTFQELPTSLNLNDLKTTIYLIECHVMVFPHVMMLALPHCKFEVSFSTLFLR